MNPFVFICFLALIAVGSATKCYQCNGLAYQGCNKGVQEISDQFKIDECDGKCISIIMGGATIKGCVPFIENRKGLSILNPGAPTIDDCKKLEHCSLCDMDFCNGSVKNTGLTMSVILTLASLIFSLH